MSKRSSAVRNLLSRSSAVWVAHNENSAGVPPAVRTYLLDGEHGTFRRYLLEACLVLGLFLPWVAPLIGLCAISPIVQLSILDSRVVTPTSDCLGPNGGLCDTDVRFDYYFWNVSNAPEVRGSLPACVRAPWRCSLTLQRARSGWPAPQHPSCRSWGPTPSRWARMSHRAARSTRMRC